MLTTPSTSRDPFTITDIQEIAIVQAWRAAKAEHAASPLWTIEDADYARITTAAVARAELATHITETACTRLSTALRRRSRPVLGGERLSCVLKPPHPLLAGAQNRLERGLRSVRPTNSHPPPGGHRNSSAMASANRTPTIFSRGQNEIFSLQNRGGSA